MDALQANADDSDCLSGDHDFPISAETGDALACRVCSRDPDAEAEAEAEAEDPAPCSATTTVPTTVPVDSLVERLTGYPADAVATCCRARGHDGEHLAVLPLASTLGSFCWKWA